MGNTESSSARIAQKSAAVIIPPVPSSSTQLGDNVTVTGMVSAVRLIVATNFNLSAKAKCGINGVLAMVIRK
jgi:hypothetical protein